MSTLKRTALFTEHEKLGAKMIPFGGWEMPVQFSSIIKEHEQTRKGAGLFDVSHMGKITVSGPDSFRFLQKLVTNDVRKLTPNKAQYALMCNEQGGTIDDFLLYMMAKEHYLLVVNAANITKDLTWLQQHQADYKQVAIQDDTEKFSMLALQGPKAITILEQLTDENIKDIKPFTCKGDVLLHDINTKVLLSRTGYTGEDGFEIFMEKEASHNVWHVILQKGKKESVILAGLGARDTLRLEAGLPLYGQELTEKISPIEAGLPFAVKITNEKEFIGKNELQKQLEHGTERKIVGIEMIDKGIPRLNYSIFYEEKEIGKVTSGTFSPTLKKYIGFALIDSSYSEIGTTLFVQVRKKMMKAQVVKTPFYHRFRR